MNMKKTLHCLPIIISMAAALALSGCAGGGAANMPDDDTAAMPDDGGQTPTVQEQVAVPSPAATPSTRRITTEREFRDLLVGKKITNKDGYVVTHEDGTLTGKFGKKELTGTWSWEGEYFCRTAKLGKKDFGLDCQVVVVSEDKVTYTRKRGKGKKNTYRIQEPES